MCSTAAYPQHVCIHLFLLCHWWDHLHWRHTCNTVTRFVCCVGRKGHNRVIWSVKPGTICKMGIKPVLFVMHNRMLILHAHTLLRLHCLWPFRWKESKVCVGEQLSMVKNIILFHWLCLISSVCACRYAAFAFIGWWETQTKTMLASHQHLDWHVARFITWPINSNKRMSYLKTVMRFAFQSWGWLLQLPLDQTHCHKSK